VASVTKAKPIQNTGDCRSGLEASTGGGTIVAGDMDLGTTALPIDGLRHLIVGFAATATALAIGL
jgi:hypothetical protein